MVTTNLLGPIRLTAALTSIFAGTGRLNHHECNVRAGFPAGRFCATYSATKAAMHSYTLSLRFQIQKTETEVIELIPPYVQTNLGPNHGIDSRAMPLAEFIAEVSLPHRLHFVVAPD